MKKESIVALISLILGLGVFLPQIGVNYILVTLFPFLNANYSPALILIIPLFLIISYGVSRKKRWGEILGIVIYSIISVASLLFIIKNLILGGIGYIVFEIPFIIFLIISSFCAKVLWKSVKGNKVLEI